MSLRRQQEGDYNINTLGIKADDKNTVGTNTCDTTADHGEEGYQVDGVFIPITQVNEFALANRDRFLEITRRARRAQRAKDGPVTLIEK
jgi:hypothetical protein